jgi:hypothetical protein
MTDSIPAFQDAQLMTDSLRLPAQRPASPEMYESPTLTTYGEVAGGADLALDASAAKSKKMTLRTARKVRPGKVFAVRIAALRVLISGLGPGQVINESLAVASAQDGRLQSIPTR